MMTVNKVIEGPASPTGFTRCSASRGQGLLVNAEAKSTRPGHAGTVPANNRLQATLGVLGGGGPARWSNFSFIRSRGGTHPLTGTGWPDTKWKRCDNIHLGRSPRLGCALSHQCVAPTRRNRRANRLEPRHSCSAPWANLLPGLVSA